MAQTVKCLSAIQETRVRSLDWEDPLEKEMAAHSSILAWKIPWMENLVDYCPWGRKESDTTEWFHFHWTCFPGGSGVKNLLANAGDVVLISVSGRFPWRRKWQPTPVFLLGKSHGQRSLVGYSSWSHSRTWLSNETAATTDAIIGVLIRGRQAC